MRKSIKLLSVYALGFLMAFAILWSGSLDVFARNSVEMDEVAELRTIMEGLIKDVRYSSPMTHSRDDGAYFDSINRSCEEMHESLRELAHLFIEASEIQGMLRGRPMQTAAILSISRPMNSRERFHIRLTNEAYIELADIISDFTGIPEERIVITIMEDVPVIYWSTRVIGYFNADDDMIITDYEWLEEFGNAFELIHHDIEKAISDECPERYTETSEEADLEARSISVLPMGTRLAKRINNSLVDWATLGHPRDVSGRTGFSTFHWDSRIHPGLEIVVPGVSPATIGVIRNARLDARDGVDVSYIEMRNGFTVSPSNPATGARISSFFQALPANPRGTLVRTFTSRSGSPSGVITGPLVEVLMTMPDGRQVFMDNMIETNIMTRRGDSGSVLINVNTNGVLGTLAGGNNSISWFSRSTAYRDLR